VVALTPSVIMVINFDGRNVIVDEKLSNFYRGFAHVCLKNSIFQPSNAKKHAVEQMSLLDTMDTPCPVLFVMTDGGPDHNCKYLAVRMI